MPRHRLTVLLAALLLQGGVARAAPLDKDGCNKLKEEQGQLEKSGVRDNLAKGPLWAKANLGGDKLGEVRRLIEVDEQLLFRCAGKPLLVLPLEAEGASASDAKDGSKSEGKATSAKASSGETSPPAVKRAAVQGAAKDTAEGKARSRPTGGKGPAITAPSKPSKANAGEEATVAPNHQPKSTANSTANSTGKSLAKSAAKSKSQPRADDAYRPPDGPADANPFASPTDPAANK